MANLNVRERVIEAKIAYVGAERSGKHANFIQLSKSMEAVVGTLLVDEASLSLDVRPREGFATDDCTLLLRLAGHRGSPTASSLHGLLDDADGVVVVVEAIPSARDTNRRAVDAVRVVLGAREIPVLLQINKSDVEGALPSSEILEALEIAGWPCVAASALEGSGVEETLNLMTRDVIQAMNQSKPLENESKPSSETRRGEGNPLLTALRGVLDKSIELHVGELGARLERHLGAQLDDLAVRVDAVERGQALLLAAANRSASREDVVTATGALSSLIDVERQVLSKVDARIGVIEGEATLLMHSLTTTTQELLTSARHACTREDLATATGDLQADLVRAIETSAEAGREYATTTAAVLRRSIDGVSAEVKKASSKDTLTAIATKLGDVEKHTRAALEDSKESVTSSAARLEDATSSVARELRASVDRRLAALDLELREIRDIVTRAATTAGNAEERSLGAATLLSELVEELKKPKKGWFG